MIDMIAKYWVQELFAVIIAFVSWLFQRVLVWKKEQDVVREGIVAILHDRLYTSCIAFIDQGYCTVDDRENLEYLYKPYKALGGNGTAEKLFDKCEDLPLKQEGASRTREENNAEGE